MKRMNELIIEFDDVIKMINRVTFAKYGVVIPILDLEQAISADFCLSNSWPSEGQCIVMMSATEDSEDAQVSNDIMQAFPKTFAEMEKAWQIPRSRGFRRDK